MQKIARRLLFITQEGVYNMNENNAKTMYEAVPAASELNKVPGFDPVSYTHLGEIVTVNAPAGEIRYTVDKIER